MSRRVLDAHFARLRAEGVVRKVTLIDPRRARRPVECVVLVRLAGHTPMAIERFEARVMSDPDVLRADWISGRFDYQLATFHNDVRSLTAWRRVLEAEPYVAVIQQKVVQTVCGTSMNGVLLQRQAGMRKGRLPAS